MIRVEIDYNPYKMKTSMKINGIDVQDEKRAVDYSKFRKLITQGTPLQTWIEPIEYMGWKGFVNELIEEDQNDDVTIVFSGREIDFKDLQRAIEVQNKERNVEPPARFKFEHKGKLDDKILADNIDAIVNELRSRRFRELVEKRNGEVLQKKYEQLNENYTQAKNTEFDVVFAGIYSSGKSTILNTLMRHGVLPTDDGTCTSKNCRICHDASLGKKISLTAYHGKDKIFEKKVFSTDADCAAFFQEICPIEKGKKPKYEAVDTIELGADLSHLYPKSVSADKFRIVLIDTPGMDSSQSSMNGVNLHEQVALDAIEMDTKPMVVMCIKADDADNVSIGGFMQKITRQSEKDKGGFNDRFLFLMNKSDVLKFKRGVNLNTRIQGFAEYLTNASRWGETDTKDIEAAAHFVPRIFPVSALVEWAVQDDASHYTKDDLEDDDIKRDTYRTLEDFKDDVKEQRDNKCLARHCGIPAYRKDEVEKEFQKSLEAKDYDRAAQIQSGIGCVEIAIRDYIARYAYPIKVRALLGTFQDILMDVDSFNQNYLRELQEAVQKQGEKSTEREGVQDEKHDLERKRMAIEKAEKDVEIRKNKLSQVKFDSTSLDLALGRLRVAIDADATVNEFRPKDKKIFTGQMSPEEVRKMIYDKLHHIELLYAQGIGDTNVTLRRLQNNYNDQLKEIFDFLKATIEELRAAGAFEANGYDFTRTVEWRTNFEGLNVDTFASKVEADIRDRTTRPGSTTNWQKEEWGSSWNPFKKIASLFMADSVPIEIPVDGYYQTKEVAQAMTDYMINLMKQTDEMKKASDDFLNASTRQVKNLTEQLLRALNGFIVEIRLREKKVAELSNDLKQLNAEIEEYQNTCDWLNDLKDRLQGV